MRKLFPVINDPPETPTVVAGYIYAAISFWTFPFIMLLLLNDSFQNETWVAWGEIAYHVINFIIVISLFRSYLADSFFNVEFNLSNFLTVVGISIGLMTAIVAGSYILFQFNEAYVPYLVAFCALPLSEMDLFTVAGGVVEAAPVWGTICMALIVPFTTSLIYYATAFAPMCSKHPRLAYLIVALVIAIPRILNSLTYWDPATELTLYLIQLPFHLIACWSYQQTDTVWAPIFTHMGANLLYSVFIILLRFVFHV